jgi:hypothetical protein
MDQAGFRRPPDSRVQIISFHQVRQRLKHESFSPVGGMTFKKLHHSSVY